MGCYRVVFNKLKLRDRERETQEVSRLQSFSENFSKPIAVGSPVTFFFKKFTRLCLIFGSVSAVTGSGLASLHLPDPDLRPPELPAL